MRCLKTTIDYKLCCQGKDLDLKGYIDVDWIKYLHKRKSTFGYVFLIK